MLGGKASRLYFSKSRFHPQGKQRIQLEETLVCVKFISDGSMGFRSNSIKISKKSSITASFKTRLVKFPKSGEGGIWRFKCTKIGATPSCLIAASEVATILVKGGKLALAP